MEDLEKAGKDMEAKDMVKAEKDMEGTKVLNRTAVYI